MTNWCMVLSAAIHIDLGSHLLPYNLMTFALPLFTVANGVVTCKKGNKLGFRVMDRGSGRVSMVRVRVRVWARVSDKIRVSYRVVWG